jgi:uncharacterized protein DUF4242
VQYMLEMYGTASGRQTAASTVDDVKDAARMMRNDGVSIRYVRSIVIPADETCLHVLEASSAAIVRDAMDRAGIRFERIVPVTEVRGHHF